MVQTGRVEQIHIAPDTGSPVAPIEKIEAIKGRGLRGDRYFKGSGLWNIIDDDTGTQQASDVTLIEAEAIEAIERDYEIVLEAGAHRRNVTTRNVGLNHLVDEEFTVGEAVIEGIGLCEPCGYLQSITGVDSLGTALIHRGGLDARIVESGTIRVGDEIRW